MKQILPLVILLVVPHSRLLGDTYEILLSAQAWGNSSFSHPLYDPYYLFYPYINVLENGSPTDASVTLSSRTTLFEGYVNVPGTGIARSSFILTTGQVVSEVNGTWNLTLLDGAQTYQYEVDISFAPPFSELPRFTALGWSSGPSNGSLQWMLDAGSAGFPGPLSTTFARIGPVFGPVIDSATLPNGVTTWNPNIAQSGVQEFVATIRTSLEASDLTSLRILDVRAVTAGAPSLSFSSPSVTYKAERVAKLGPPVPEPVTATLAICALSLMLFRRRSITVASSVQRSNFEDGAPLPAPGS